MADVGVDQVHVAGLALVLLEGGDRFESGDQFSDRVVGVLPAGVVGGVAEILHAVGGQLGFLAGGDIAHPQVPVADEGFGLSVRRQHARLMAAFGRFAVTFRAPCA